jgi:hypothetical protein
MTSSSSPFCSSWSRFREGSLLPYYSDDGRFDRARRSFVTSRTMPPSPSGRRDKTRHSTTWSNVYKYYITYRLVNDQRERRAAAKAEVGKRK